MTKSRFDEATQRDFRGRITAPVSSGADEQCSGRRRASLPERRREPSCERVADDPDFIVGPTGIVHFDIDDVDEHDIDHHDVNDDAHDDDKHINTNEWANVDNDDDRGNTDDRGRTDDHVDDDRETPEREDRNGRAAARPDAGSRAS